MSEAKDSAGEKDLITLKRRRGQAKAAVTKMITAVNVKIRENKPEELKTVLESLDLALIQLQEAHRCYHDRLTDDIDEEESDAYEKLILMSVHDVRHKALAWLHEVKHGVDDHPDGDEELDVTNQHDLVNEPQVDPNDEDSVSVELEMLQALRKKRNRKTLNCCFDATKRSSNWNSSECITRPS